MFLLLLVGADLTNLQRSLTALRPHVSGWVAMDVGSGDSQGLIESCLPGIPGTFASRPWKGEAANREELINLAPFGEGHAMLLDSSMSVDVGEDFDVSMFASDYVLCDVSDGLQKQLRCLIFRRSVDLKILVADNYYVKTEDDNRSTIAEDLSLIRPISSEPFHAFGSAQSFITLSETYAAEGRFQVATNLLEGALTERLSPEDRARIHVQLGRVYSGQSRFAEAFLQYSTAFTFDSDLLAEKFEAVVMLNIAKEFRLARHLLKQYFRAHESGPAVHTLDAWQISLEEGVAEHGLGDLSSARNSFNAILSNPESPSAYRDLAHSNLQWC